MNINQKSVYWRETEFIWLNDHNSAYIRTTRLKSLLRCIPRVRSRPGGDTFPNGLLFKPIFIYKPLFTVMVIMHSDRARILAWGLFISFAIVTFLINSAERK